MRGRTERGAKENVGRGEEQWDETLVIMMPVIARAWQGSSATRK